MNHFWKNVAALLVLIAIIVAAGAWYMGAFDTYEVDNRTMGPYNFVYQEYVGPYAQSGAVFTEVHDNLLADGIGTSVALGMYYDNPDMVSTDELRSELGSVIDEVQATMLPDTYQMKVIDAREYAVVRFPYKNMLSYMIGPMITYSILDDYFGEAGITADHTVELYTEDAIYYMVPTE